MLQNWKVLGQVGWRIPNFKKLAEQENLTSAQLLLNWAVSQGVAVLPSARSKKHMEENLACCQKALSVEDSINHVQNGESTTHHSSRSTLDLCSRCCYW